MRTLVVRTVEDASVESRPARIPFANANLFLGGRVVAVTLRDGAVVDDAAGSLGTAAAWAVVAGPLDPGTVARFHLELTLADGFYAATGTAHVISNDVPQPGVVLAACALRVTEAPGGARGAATSLSVFDPRGLGDAGTGSIWTLRLYDP